MSKRAILAAVLALAVSVGCLMAQNNPMLVKYPRYVQGGATQYTGVPFTVLGAFQTSTAPYPCTLRYKVRLPYLTTGKQYMWIDSTALIGNLWAGDGVAWANSPTFYIQSSTDTFWVWAAVKDTSTVLGDTQPVRFRCRRGSTNYDSQTPDTVEVLDMSGGGNGGWLAGHLYASSGGPARQNYAVLAFRGDTIVGSALTEDNRVNEGQDSLDAGYFHMAVKAGVIDSLQLFYRTEHAVTSPYYTLFPAPWTVLPGATTWVENAPSGPVVENVERDIDWPLSSETVTVSADVYKPGGTVDSTFLFFSTDALIWYRVAPGSNVDSTYYFAIPPQLGGDTVQYYVKGWCGTDTTISPFFSYELPVDLSIYDIQYCDTTVTEVSPRVGDYVHAAGIVTGWAGTDRAFIADAPGPWNGLLVYGIGLTFDVGDSLDVAGIIAEYNGMTELSFPLRVDVHGGGHAVDTADLVFGDAHLEAYEGVLARLDSVQIADGSAFFTAGSHAIASFDLTDTIDAYVYSGSLIEGEPVPPGTFDLVCNIGDYNERQLIPRYPSDVILGVDCEAVDILAPPRNVNEGDTVTPTAVFRNNNVAAAAENVTVTFSIGSVYVVQQSLTALAPGQTDTVEFTDWQAVTGDYTVQAKVIFAGDPDPSNDTVTGDLTVHALPPPPGPGVWVEKTPMPTGAGPVRDGGWLVNDDDIVYAAKGNKTNEFYRYFVDGDSWVPLPPMPYATHPEWYKKAPRKGSEAAYGDDYVYVTQGNNTLGFWRYAVAGDSWDMLADVPEGPSGKKVKGGTDLVYYHRGDTGYIYLLKGYRTEFYRYSTVTGSWYQLSDAPTGTRAKWDRGSWLGITRTGGGHGQGSPDIYAHKAKYNELWQYYADGDSWSQRTGMPFIGMSGRRKKSKDGGTSAFYDGCFYALKGGNTQEFWCYYTDGDSWVELDTLPSNGSTGRKKRVKSGAGIVSTGGGAFYALKGNKTLELWRYGDTTAAAPGRPRDPRSGVMARSLAGSGFELTVAPNPLNGRFATLSYSLPRPGPVMIRVYDVAGRERLHLVPGVGRRASGVTLDLRGFSAGVYLLRLDAGAFSTTRKLVVQ